VDIISRDMRKKAMKACKLDYMPICSHGNSRAPNHTCLVALFYNPLQIAEARIQNASVESARPFFAMRKNKCDARTVPRHSRHPSIQGLLTLAKWKGSLTMDCRTDAAAWARQAQGAQHPQMQLKSDRTAVCGRK